MRAFVGSLLTAAIIGGVSCGMNCKAAMAADLSAASQWLDKFPYDKIAGGKSLWDQPGIEDAMRAAMGEALFERSKKELHGPESPVAGDGKSLFAVWSCKSADCGGNQMTVFLDTAKGSAQVCWRGSAGDGGKVRDLWLANGKSRPLPVNACGFAGKDPFAALKKFGAAG